MGSPDEQSSPPSQQALICIVSSSGGIKALSDLVERLPAELPAALVIVQHLHPTFKSRLSEILSWHTTRRVHVVGHDDLIEQGSIYVAPPDNHVRVTPGNRLSLLQDAKVDYLRPSGDVLLISAAEHYQGRVIGIILTGTGHDGSDGAEAVHRAGGVVIVQEPESARFRAMPDSAIATGVANYVLSLEEMWEQVASILETGATA